MCTYNLYELLITSYLNIYTPYKKSSRRSTVIINIMWDVLRMSILGQCRIAKCNRLS